MHYLFIESLCMDNPHSYYTLKHKENAWSFGRIVHADEIYAYFAML